VGLEPVNRMAYYGLLGPKGLPAAVVERVHGAARKSLDDAGVAKRIADTGSLVIGNSPKEFADQIVAEYKVYQDVVKRQKLSL
ncbi:MAG: ABC transporter substrate-binding protein, partial [Burkholderiaceae bacterium]